MHYDDMRSVWRISTEPALEPVTTSEAVTQCRENQDAPAEAIEYISALITVSRGRVEQELNRALITQTWSIYFDDFPGENQIELPLGELQTVNSFVYTDKDDTTTALTEGTTNDYVVDIKSPRGRVILSPDTSWPSTTLHPNNPIRIDFTCGYGSGVSAVPGPIKHAIKLLIAHQYENREQTVVGIKVTEIPEGAAQLLSPYKFYNI